MEVRKRHRQEGKREGTEKLKEVRGEEGIKERIRKMIRENEAREVRGKRQLSNVSRITSSVG